jgi:glucoamylase
MEPETTTAPGHPGIPPRWTSSAKTGVGTALSPLSRVWFTLSHGILNEVYYPRLDQACTRDLGLLVTDGETFFSEEKRHTHSQLERAAPGIPAFRLTNTCLDGRYQIIKEIITDPKREVLLQRIRFTPQLDSPSGYHLYVLLAPHLGNRGMNNTAWVGDYKGIPMLLAEGNGSALAMACSVPWLVRSAGFVGFSDGWQDIFRHKKMTWQYAWAENGNVALTGEIDLSIDGDFALALGFGRSAVEAAQRARASLLDGFDPAWKAYLKDWQNWQRKLLPLENPPVRPVLYRISTTVLRSHEAKSFPGGLIASLSLPWGETIGDDDLGGYHLVWARDLVEIAGGFLAAGAHFEARRVLDYLQSTQEADGYWSQNMWLDGTPYWSGIQMDETAFPILLLDLAMREKAVHAQELDRYWPMVRKAASYLLRNGPVTDQDRWEEDSGYSPFTLAVEIAALLAAADIAEQQSDPATAQLLRETADAWNADIERWTFVSGTDLARQLGVSGYYVRIAPPEVGESGTLTGGFVPIKNRPPGESSAPAAHIVSPDALALVRFGLRAPDDPRILATIKVIDALLKCETSSGPAWYRYNDDGYGEHADGSPYDGTGIGRPWPLLTGERAHYELAAGHPETAAQLLRTMEAFANQGGMLPEQIWNAVDIPERELFSGQPSGSAMPLAWAHAEYIKLCRSLRDGRVFDLPPQPIQRYKRERVSAQFALWQFSHKRRTMPAGAALRIGLKSPALIHWRIDENLDVSEVPTCATNLNFHIANLPTQALPPGTRVRFLISSTELPEESVGEFQIIIEK